MTTQRLNESTGIQSRVATNGVNSSSDLETAEYLATSCGAGRAWSWHEVTE